MPTALDVISELVSPFSKKPIFGYSFVAFSSLAIAVFGFIVWAHHMFVAGISTYDLHYIMVGGAIMSYLGMPRRYHAYPPEFQVLNVMPSVGAVVPGIATHKATLVFFLAILVGETMFDHASREFIAGPKLIY